MRLFFLLLLSLLPQLMAAQVTTDTGTVLELKITDLKNTRGKVLVSLFIDEASFLKTPYKTVAVDISEAKEALARFDGLKAGAYALAVFHDKNDNGELDTNFLGIPKEGYGWSNNPKPTFRAARYDECMFTIATGSDTLSLEIQII